MAEERAEKIKQSKQKLMFIEVSLKNAQNNLSAGKVVRASDIDELITSRDALKKEIARLEDVNNPLNPGVETEHIPLSPLDRGEETKTDDEYGIPEKLRIKRPYTMSVSAREQRRKAANSPKLAEAMHGNKNAWKHGQYAEGFIRQSVVPCKSTCKEYETCDFVQSGETTAGGPCLDRAVDFIKILMAVQTAARDGKLDDFKDVASISMAGTMNLIEKLLLDINIDGTLIKSEMFGKDGARLGYKIASHPSFKPLAELIEAMEIKPTQFMMTPLMVKKMKTESKKVKSLASLMSGFGLGEAPDEDDEVETAKGEGED